jgi:hypothetical protein
MIPIHTFLNTTGKTYQFRIKSYQSDYFSYVAYFQTKGNWEIIEIPFSVMYPVFRGKKLNTKNYPGNQMELFAFLIGNKKAESFQLEIEHIELN